EAGAPARGERLRHLFGPRGGGRVDPRLVAPRADHLAGGEPGLGGHAWRDAPVARDVGAHDEGAPVRDERVVNEETEPRVGGELRRPHHGERVAARRLEGERVAHEQREPEQLDVRVEALGHDHHAEERGRVAHDATWEERASRSSAALRGGYFAASACTPERAVLAMTRFTT